MGWLLENRHQPDAAGMSYQPDDRHLELSRSTVYYRPVPVSDDDLTLAPHPGHRTFPYLLRGKRSCRSTHTVAPRVLERCERSSASQWPSTCSWAPG